MKTITLNEIESKELPLYLEHMGRFYLLSAVPSDWTLIPPVHPASGTSLEVYASRAYNVYSAEEFKEVLGGIEQAQEEERKTEVIAQDGNHALGKEEVLAAHAQKAADLETAKELVAASLSPRPVADDHIAETFHPLEGSEVAEEEKEVVKSNPSIAEKLTALKK